MSDDKEAQTTIEALPLPHGGQTHAVDGDSCRAFFRLLAAGIAVVTTHGPDGMLGITVSTVTSLSREPPLLLLCIHYQSRALAAIRQCGDFVVHLLREDQELQSSMFAVTNSAGERHALFDTTQAGGLPLLNDCLAWARCTLETTFYGGDHTIVVGRIVQTNNGHGAPLLWHRSGYRRLATASENGS